MTNIRQMKLVSGEEVIAEIIQYSDEENAAMIVRAVLKVIASERADGFRYYALRPWMIYAEDMNELLTINSDQVVGEMFPSTEIMKQYVMTVQEYVKNSEKKAEAEKEMTEEVQDWSQKLLDDIASDSDGTVVRLFPSGNKTMH